MSAAELLLRVQAANGPDRELDADLWWAFDRDRAKMPFWNASLGLPKAELPERLPEGLGRAGVRVSAPAFTASADAALTLIERVLPGCWYVLGRGCTRPDEPLYGAALYRGDADVRDGNLGKGEHEASLPLAILVALLSAKAEGRA